MYTYICLMIYQGKQKENNFAGLEASTSKIKRDNESSTYSLR